MALLTRNRRIGTFLNRRTPPKERAWSRVEHRASESIALTALNRMVNRMVEAAPGAYRCPPEVVLAARHAVDRCWNSRCRIVVEGRVFLAEMRPVGSGMYAVDRQALHDLRVSVVEAKLERAKEREATDERESAVVVRDGDGAGDGIPVAEGETEHDETPTPSEWSERLRQDLGGADDRERAWW
jgi:hypothetical protein